MPERHGETPFIIPKPYALKTLKALQDYGILGLHIRCIKCGHAVPWPFPWLAKAHPDAMDSTLEYFAARIRCRVCRSPRVKVKPYREYPVKED